jgi:hypothetical protein
MVKRGLVGLTVLVVALALAGIALAQVSTNFDLGWHLLSGGGGSRGSASHQIDDTLGQWAGGSSESATNVIAPGFWSAAVVPSCPDPLEDVTIEGPTTGLADTPYVFTASIVPAGATEPIVHTWSTDGLVSGQGTDTASYQWATTGLKPITVLSQNCGGAGVSDAHAITIQSPAAGDAYEEDDTCGVADTIASDGTIQVHTFHDEGDEDWVTFDAVAGKTYVIQVDNVGADVDAVVMLHDQCDQAPLESDDNAFGPTVTMEWDCTASGSYYLGLLQNDPAIYGEATNYDLSVEVDSEAPSPPRSLWATPANQALIVQWEASTERDVAGYRVRWGLTSGPPYGGSHLVDGKDTTYHEITGLTNGTPYYVVITSLDLSGNESVYSDEIGAIPSDSADPTSPTVVIDRPTTALVYTSTVTSLTVGGDCTDGSNNLSRVRVRNLTNASVGWDYSLSGGSASFNVTAVPMNVGDNSIEVTVYDAADNTDTDTINIRRISGLNGAVVIVGGRNNSSSLQNNINNLTNRAYTVFRGAGFGAEDIYYLSPSPQDADGDGSSDVSSPTTPANVHAAIQWAAGRVGPGVPFYLYLMDHGGTELFCANGCTPSDTDHVITPDELDDWLDELETSSGCDLVNVIIEACHSGSFLDRTGDVLKSISEAGRVVMSSTGRTNNAYASAQGAYFSDAFFSSVVASNSLLTSFNQAKSAVDATGNNQTPWLDDNGDGLSNPADGTIASSRYVASYFGTLLPDITAASVSLAGSSGTIEATVLRGDEAIDIVWAAVYAPSFQEPAYTSLELGVPLIELEADPLQEDVYSASYNAFSEEGVYRVVIYAADEVGNQGQPKSIQTGDQVVYLPLTTKG